MHTRSRSGEALDVMFATPMRTSYDSSTFRAKYMADATRNGATGKGPRPLARRLPRAIPAPARGRAQGMRSYAEEYIWALPCAGAAGAAACAGRPAACMPGCTCCCGATMGTGP